jgi:hypothetical protein
MMDFKSRCGRGRDDSGGNGLCRNVSYPCLWQCHADACSKIYNAISLVVYSVQIGP